MRDVQAARLPRQGSMFAMRQMAIGVFVIVAAGVAIPAHAQGHHGAGRGGPDGGSGMMMFGGSPEHIGRSVDKLANSGAGDCRRESRQHAGSTKSSRTDYRRDHR